MSDKKTINLALQGGGSHGAFTWGVLDYLLEDGRFDFECVTATSAGAMNAVALAHGLLEDGQEGARESLQDFWYEVSASGGFLGTMKNATVDLNESFRKYIPDWAMASTPYYKYTAFENFTDMFSPYQFNPLNFNALRPVLEKTVDMERLRSSQEGLKIFLNATNVRTGAEKVFSQQELSIDVVLASAALPFLFQAVEVEGEKYWDGGYMGNPSLWPLFYNAQSRDVLIVHINPIIREELPQQAFDIENRINEITFNATFLKEIRSIAFVKKLLKEDMLKEEHKDKYKNMLLHAVRTDKALTEVSIATKFSTDWTFLQHLRDLGRAEAAKWVKEHYEDVGQRDSVDIEKDYLRL